MASASDLREADILNLMEIQDLPGLFVLSPFEHPVNVASQQMRATNLVHAIDRTRAKRDAPGAPPEPKLNIAIVGAGVAGCTAAAHALLLGHSVTLLERSDHEFGPLNGAGRYIDPTLYEWPVPGWSDDQPATPVMRWKASIAGDVVQGLAEQLRSWRTLYPDDLRLVNGVHVYADDILAIGGRLRLEWRSHSGSSVEQDDFDAVILAVGFGPERLPRSKSLKVDPYWEQAFDGIADDQRCLIVGNGDGGCADLIRTFLRSDETEFHLRSWAELVELSTQEELLEIETEMRRLPRVEQSRMLARRYGALECPALDAELTRELRPVSVHQVGRTSHYLNPGTYLLNRFLVSRIVRLAGDRYRYSTRLADVWSPEEEAETVWARLPEPHDHVGREELLEFDRLVYRAGPIYNLQAYPELFDRCRDLEAVTRLGLSRRVLWSRRSGSTGQHKLGITGGIDLRLYSDFYDPPVQAALADLLDGEDGRRLALGRLRFHCLLYDYVALTDAQLIDGSLLGRLSADDIRSLLPQLEFHLRGGSIAESFERLCSGQVRLSSLSDPEREALMDICRRHPNAEAIVGEAERSGIGGLPELAQRVARWDDLVTRSLVTRVYEQAGAPTVVGDADPGQLHAGLPPSGQGLFETVYRMRHHPRSEVLNAIESNAGGADGVVVDRVRNWYHRVYNAAIAAKLRCPVTETVWVGESDWMSTSAGNGVSEPSPGQGGFDLQWRLGGISESDYSDVKRAIESDRLRWLLGRSDLPDFLTRVDRLLPAAGHAPAVSVAPTPFGRWAERESRFQFGEVPWQFDRDENSNRFVLSEWAGGDTASPMAIAHFTHTLFQPV